MSKITEFATGEKSLKSLYKKITKQFKELKINSHK